MLTSLHRAWFSGSLSQVVVTSLRLSNVPVRCASAGQTVTFKLAERSTNQSPVISAEVPTTGAAGLTLPPHLGIGRRRSSATGLVLLSPPGAGAHGTVGDPASDAAVPSSSVRAGLEPAPAPMAAPVIPPTMQPLAHWEFEAELLVLNHPAKIRVNYEPVVHVGCVKQSAKIISIRKITANHSTAAGAGSGSVAAGKGNGAAGSNGKAEPSTGHNGAGQIGNDEVGNSERALCR